MASSSAPTQNDQTTIDNYQAEALTPLRTAQALTVKDAASYARAGDLKVQALGIRQRIEEWFQGTKAAPGPKALAYQAWQSLCKKEKDALGSLAEAEKLLGRKMTEYLRADEVRRQAAQRVADAEARRKAEDERVDAAVAIEQTAVALGDHALLAAAEEMIELPIEIAPVYVASDLPKIAGLPVRHPLKVTVNDLRAVILSVAAREMLDDLGREGDHELVLLTEKVSAFLHRYAPPRRSALQPIRRDAVNAIEGGGCVDLNMKWLRAEADEQGEAFELPGVTVSRDATV